MKILPPTAKMNPADFSRAYRQLSVGPDVSVDDLLRPGFWVHHAEKTGVFDIIDVLSTDGALDVSLRVIGKERGMLFMRPLRIHAEQGRQSAEPVDTGDVPDGYVVDFTDKTSWRARTRNPAFVLAEGKKTRQEAVAACVEHASKSSGASAPEPLSETPDGVPTLIPDNWEELHWKQQLKLAEEISGGPVIEAHGKTVTERARDIIAATVEARADDARNAA